MESNTSTTPASGEPTPVGHLPVGWLLFGLALIFAWRVFFTVSANLIPDECSYWTWSRRLDWSYFDNSGMVAYLIRLSTTLFGDNTPLSVRFPFLILSVATTYLVYRVSLLLFGDRSRALLLAVLYNATPIALLGGAAAVHDNALLFFWALTLWSVARFLKSQDPRWFYVIGIATGLAILSKYTGVLLLPSLLLFFLWVKRVRPWLRRKEPWFGVLIALVFTLPIVWWNVVHEWTSLSHVLFIGGGATSTGKRITDGLGYHLAQFILVSPLFYLALIIACGATLKSKLFRPSAEYALLLSFGLPVVLFGVQAFRGHVEANWAVMGYLSAAVLAVEVIWAARSENVPGIWKKFDGRYLKWGFAVSIVPVMLAVLHAWIGLLPAAIERKIAKEDRIIWETRGWDGLGKHVAELQKPGDVLAADSYQLCALLEFNVPGNPEVRYLAPWRRPAQFDVWEPSFDNLNGRTILYVSPIPLVPTSDVRLSIYENFKSVEPLEPYEVLYHGESIRQIFVYRGASFDPFSPRRLGPRSLFYRDY
ncbi:MAG: glycosyltransferase family 39 protein [Desulfomonile tiedjei]|nr:glycosyltransferase family 39 protein [Desulfomonile tiedjei]